MSGKLTRIAFRQLIAEDIVWLEDQPCTLERDHIISIVRESERYYYEDAQDEVMREAVEKALRPLETFEREAIARLLSLSPQAYRMDSECVRFVNAILEARKGHP